MHTAYAETGAQILGPLKLITPPSGMVVTRKEAKGHAKKLDNDEDAFVDLCIRTSTNLCEEMISGHRQFLTASRSVAIAGWWCGSLKLPRPPLQTIDGVFYFDSDEVQQTLDADLYVVETYDGQPGTIELRNNITLSSLWCDRQYPIQIHFTCGYGAAADVPPEIKMAILVGSTQLICNRCTIDQEVRDAVARHLENSVGYGCYA